MLSAEGRWLAGVLAAGPDAVLSRRSAAALWDLRPELAGPVEVTAPRCLRSRPGLRVSRAAFADDERTRRCGIPVTTPARTLLDLAGVLPRHALERAAEAAEQLGVCDGPTLDALLTRYHGRKGVRALRQIADTGRASRITRSELESRFLAFLERFGLPSPQTNVRIAVGGRTLEVDCVWPAARVVVELDGHAYHATRAAFERDRERDRLLQAAGWRVIRITWRQLRDEPEALARDLHRLLRAGCT
ncbi:MAG: endonuclease domain-containing protein [Actinomycetota bacterium]|nr:endonuclease domain-containing protein [Actinomycetota bacterium]